MPRVGLVARTFALQRSGSIDRAAFHRIKFRMCQSLQVACEEIKPVQREAFAKALQSHVTAAEMGLVTSLVGLD